MSKKILIIEDDRQIANLLQAFLEKSGFQTTSAWTGPQGLEEFRSQPRDLVIVDIFLPGLNGHRIIEELRKEPNPPRIIAISSVQEILDQAIALGADRGMKKPLKMLDLGDLVAELLPAA